MVSFILFILILILSLLIQAYVDFNQALNLFLRTLSFRKNTKKHSFNKGFPPKICPYIDWLFCLQIAIWILTFHLDKLALNFGLPRKSLTCK